MSRRDRNYDNWEDDTLIPSENITIPLEDGTFAVVDHLYTCQDCGVVFAWVNPVPPGREFHTLLCDTCLKEQQDTKL